MPSYYMCISTKFHNIPELLGGECNCYRQTHDKISNPYHTASYSYEACVPTSVGDFDFPSIVYYVEDITDEILAIMKLNGAPIQLLNTEYLDPCREIFFNRNVPTYQIPITATERLWMQGVIHELRRTIPKEEMISGRRVNAFC